MSDTHGLKEENFTLAYILEVSDFAWSAGSRQKRHGGRVWQGKAAHPMAARKQQGSGWGAWEIMPTVTQVLQPGSGHHSKPAVEPHNPATFHKLWLWTHEGLWVHRILLILEFTSRSYSDPTKIQNLDACWVMRDSSVVYFHFDLLNKIQFVVAVIILFKVYILLVC